MSYSGFETLMRQQLTNVPILLIERIIPRFVRCILRIARGRDLEVLYGHDD